MDDSLYFAGTARLDDVAVWNDYEHWSVVDMPTVAFF